MHVRFKGTVVWNKWVASLFVSASWRVACAAWHCLEKVGEVVQRQGKESGPKVVPLANPASGSKIYCNYAS
jgi:hypothetical protein